jgi:putative tryptophan/tyrosine transport system substrate-binding protein
MKRREFITLIGGAAAWPLAGQAQQGERVRRIGVLMSDVETDPDGQARFMAFVRSLRGLGWVDGRNIRIDHRWSGGDANRARTLATELLGTGPEVILSSSTIALSALQPATSTIPIVFVAVTDPVAGGFVASLAHPGANITGFTPFEYDMGGKWLEVLKETAPGLTRVVLLGDPDNHNFVGFLRSFQAAAKALSVEPIPGPVRDAADVRRAIDAFAREGNGGLIVTAATFSIIHYELIIALAARHKLPALYWNRKHVSAGGLISYGPDLIEQYMLAAHYVDRILKGEKPAGLPVQNPSKYQLVVNLRTARALGLEIPPTLLARADEVIE